MSATTISKGVGLMCAMCAPGSYSRNISTERSVTSFFHDGARDFPVSVNHVHESGVGSAAASSGF